MFEAHLDILTLCWIQAKFVGLIPICEFIERVLKLAFFWKRAVFSWKLVSSTYFQQLMLSSLFLMIT